MGTRTLLLTTLIVFLGTLIFFATSIRTPLKPLPTLYLSPNEIRGSALERAHTLYTLNFSQQNVLINSMNSAVVLHNKNRSIEYDISSFPLDFTKIIIYRFHAPDLEIYPIACRTEKLSLPTQEPFIRYHFIFSAPAWNPFGLMECSSRIDFNAFFSTIYDS